MKDPFALYMAGNPPTVTFNDRPIDEFTLDALLPFGDGSGCFTESFDVTLKGKKEFEEVSIVCITAKYESSNGEIPAIQMRIITDTGHAIYYSPVYEIGSDREFYRREWRIPAMLYKYDTVRVSFIIPEGVKLYMRDARVKRNYGWRERDIGIRYHGHGGCTSAFGFQATAEMGFTSCITIPKFTKDGLGVCLHDDSTVINEIRLDDGSIPEAGGKYDKPVKDFTYEELKELNVWNRRSDIFKGMRVPTIEEFFRICSHTGMQPIFSVHPELTKDQWIYVRELLKKYRLTEHFWVKSGKPNTNRLCIEVFEHKIAGHILIYGAKDTEDPMSKALSSGLDPKRDRIVIEFFDHVVTEEMIKTARDEGFEVSIAAMKGGVSGIRMQYLIDCGVTEFTLDHHCSMGLCW